jgi:hypothetical protein
VRMKVTSLMSFQVHAWINDVQRSIRTDRQDLKCQCHSIRHTLSSKSPSSKSLAHVQLINYLTAPNCVIWSALLASAAVPGILSPVVLRISIANLKVVLMMKTKTGRIAPYNFGHKVFISFKLVLSY